MQQVSQPACACVWMYVFLSSERFACFSSVRFLREAEPSKLMHLAGTVMLRGNH